MDRRTFLIRSLNHYRWNHAAVLVAVAVATAVISGALTVGDSVRSSLQQLALDRLGQIDHALIGRRFFSVDRASELAASVKGSAEITASSAIVATATVESPRSTNHRRARNVTLIGYDPSFWRLDAVSMDRPDFQDQVIVNRALADRLSIQVGDLLTFRLPDGNAVPADSTLGKKDARLVNLANVRVDQIIESRGLGHFSLSPTQQTTFNVFLPLSKIQTALNRQHQVNAVLVDVRSQSISATDLDQHLQLTLPDFGLRVERRIERYDGQIAWEYFNVTSDRMIWESVARQAVLSTIHDWNGQEVFTYLANRISRQGLDNVSIPYSTITAADPHPELGPFPGTLNDGEIAINQWTADRLQATVGSRLTIEAFEPESTDGDPREFTSSFQVARVLPITKPFRPARRDQPPAFDTRPTWANDLGWTPTVAGITDRDSIDNWDPPFPFDSQRIQPADDEYWDDYRTAPKAFVSLKTGHQLWHSRFGENTSFRIPVSSLTIETVQDKLAAALRTRQSDLGFRFQPLREQAVQASAGTTPFAYLFLGFSFFLIISAMALIAILFRLGLELRARELGVLRSVGWNRHQLRMAVIREAAIVAGGGAVIGGALGVAYAAIMLYGLRTWWVAAVVTPFMRLSVDPATLTLGMAIGWLAGLSIVAWTLHTIRSVEPLQMLGGHLTNTTTFAAPHRWKKRVALGIASLSLPLAIAGQFCFGETQSGLFFASGAVALLGLLLWTRYLMKIQATVAPSNLQLSRMGLAWRAATRAPGRSTLTMSMMATATFLIVAIAAFRVSPTEFGTGGFSLVGESDRAIHDNLNEPTARRTLFGDKQDLLTNVEILELRRLGGDDASCRNLYQSSRPQLLGISRPMLQSVKAKPTRFAWQAVDGDLADAWQCLDLPNQASIPVVIDKNTAMYALHLPPKIGHSFECTYGGKTWQFRIAGLLSNTILQGGLLMSEENLLRVAPETAGYRMFLVRGHRSPDQWASIAETLEDRFGDEGLTIRSADDVLADLLAIQNTYLSTFQSLGGLGLLLGTLGLGAIQVRNIISRQAELGLLQAIGFSSLGVRRQIIYENAAVLLAGLAIGVVSALVTVVPHVLSGAAQLPWAALAGMLAGITFVGLFAGVIAAAILQRQRLVAALRNE